VLEPESGELVEEWFVASREALDDWAMRKSQASTLDAYARKKARHDECVRCGAGWRPASSSTLRTEVAETAMPRPLSSPTIRLDSPSRDEGSVRGASARAPVARASGARTSTGARSAAGASEAASPA
jgi:hypothetical protein